MTLSYFLLMLGLTLRATRLVVNDTITKPIRDFFEYHAEAGVEVTVTNDVDPFNSRNVTTTEAIVPNRRRLRHKFSQFVHEMINCPWCFSVWAAAAIFLLGWGCQTPANAHIAFVWVCAAASASYVVGMLSLFMHDMERAAEE